MKLSLLFNSLFLIFSLNLVQMVWSNPSTNNRNLNSFLSPCINTMERREESSGRCYRINRQGPCKDRQKFYAIDAIRGTCDCQEDLSLVYWRATDDCYDHNQQGPCPNGQWLTLDNNNRPFCQPVPNGCQANGQWVYWRLMNHLPFKCYRLGDTGPCPFRERVQRKGLEIFCGRGSYSIARGLSNQTCPPGSKRKISGSCGTTAFG